MKDVIDQAIAATEAVRMISIPFVITETGRPAKLDIPADMSDAELLAVIAWMASGLALHLRATRDRGATRILIPDRLT